MALSAEASLSKAFVLNQERVWGGGKLLKNPWITHGWDHSKIIKDWDAQAARDQKEGVIARSYTAEEVRDLPRWLETGITAGIIISFLAGAVTGGPSGVQYTTEGPQRLDKMPHGPEGPQIGKVAAVIAFFSLLLNACKEYAKTPITKWMEKTAVPTMPPQPLGNYNMDNGQIDADSAHVEIRTGQILTGTLDTAFNEAVQNQVGINPDNVYPVSFQIADSNGNVQNLTLAVETYPGLDSAKRFFWGADWNPERAMWTALGENSDEESLSRLWPLKWEKLPGPGEHVHFFLEVFENGQLVSKDVILLNFDNNTITVIDPLTGVKTVLPKNQVEKTSPLYSLIRADFKSNTTTGDEIIPTPSPVLPEGTATPTLTVTPGPPEPFLVSPTSPSPTLTATKTPEASPTLAANPQEIAEVMNLNLERTYIISDVISGTVTTQYLVDTYNQAKMAKWDAETKVWVDTVLEEKYGHLAPKKPPISPYLGFKGETNFRGIGDDFFGPDPSFEYYILNPVMTGNTRELSWHDPEVSKEINVSAIELVFRDKNEILLKFYAYFYSPDLEGKKAFFAPIYRLDGGGYAEVFYGSYDEVMDKLLKPGNQVQMKVYYKRPANAVLPEKCFPRTGECSNEFNALHYLTMEWQDELEMFVVSLREGTEVTGLEEMLIPAYGVGVWVTQP